MRFFLIDCIDELRPFHHAIGRKAVSLSEDCFEHHFPGQPVYPGSLLLEGMAQLGGALLELSLRDEQGCCPRCVMSSVKAKFREFVRPGDQLVLRADLRSRHEDSALVQVDMTRDGSRVAQAEILYMLLSIDDLELQQSRNALLSVLTRATRMIP